MNCSKFNKSKFSTCIYDLIKEYEPKTAEELVALRELMKNLIEEEAGNYAWDCKEISDEAYNSLGEEEWEECTDEESYSAGETICSKCGCPALEISEEQYKSKYCPNCGAKMKNGE